VVVNREHDKSLRGGTVYIGMFIYLAIISVVLVFPDPGDPVKKNVHLFAKPNLTFTSLNLLLLNCSRAVNNLSFWTLERITFSGVFSTAILEERHSFSI
jgi:hypothetical protein